MSKSINSRTPFCLLIIIIAAVFITEAMVMLALPSLANMDVVYVSFLDAGLLVILLFPVLYMLLVRPLLRLIEKHTQIEDSLRQSEIALHRLSGELFKTQEVERKRIASEIHDGIGQNLSALKYAIENIIKREKRGEHNPLSEQLDRLVVILQNTIDEVRYISMELRPTILDDLGILATIQWFSRELLHTFDYLTIEKDIDVNEEQIPENLKIVIYRIMQEAVNNTIKHSDAESVLLSLRKVDGRLELRIKDNGGGFDVEKVKSSTVQKGIGLESMEERAEDSGGAFSITSSLGGGTEIKASWPLEAAEGGD